MTEAQIIKLFTEAGFTDHPEDEDEQLIWLSVPALRSSVHVFKDAYRNTYLHINNSDYSFHQRFDLGPFPKTEADAVDFIDKIMSIIKLHPNGK